MNEPVEFTEYPDELKDLAPFGPWRAVVLSVTDGDTLRCLVDQGFNSYRYLAVRIAGIDAPEMFSGPAEERERGRAARDYLTSLIAQHGPWCVLWSHKWTQSFGRYVAAVRISGDVDVATAMVDAGHAVRSER